MRAKIFLVIVGCGIGFLLGEGSLRLLFPGYVPSAGNERNYYCEFDGELGWRPLPNVSSMHQRKDFSVFVHQNQFGLRGPDSMVREKTSARKRMLIIGDSFVWGYGVDQRWIFTEQDVHQSETELINFGVSGFGTDQEYLFYKREGRLFQVDEVVLVFTPHNDVTNNLAAEQYGFLKPYFTLSNQRLVLHRDHVQENKTQSVANWFSANSRVVNLLDKARRTYRSWVVNSRPNRGAAIASTGILNASRASLRDREGVELTIQIMAALRDTVLATGARFSVVFIPYKPHILNTVSYNHPLVPLLASKLKEAQIDYFEPYFLFLDNEGPVELYNEFNNHFSPKGHAFFAQVLVDPSVRDSIKNWYSLQDRSSQKPSGSET